MTLPGNPEELGERIASAAAAFHGESKPVDVMKWMLHVMLLLDRLKEHRDWLRDEANEANKDVIAAIKRVEILYVDWTEAIFHLSAREVEKSLNPIQVVDDPVNENVSALIKACRAVRFHTCGLGLDQGSVSVDRDSMREMFDVLSKFDDAK